MPVHLVFFEDLRNDVGGCMRSIIKFMNLDIPNVDQVLTLKNLLFSSNRLFVQRLACLLENSEGNFHREKHPLDFDPWTIFDDLIPFINRQIEAVDLELKIRHLQLLPKSYKKEIST